MITEKNPFRIVLDTNVLVSAMLNPKGPPSQILKLILLGELKLIINAEIYAEYQHVLKRPKFDLDPFLVDILLDYLYDISEKSTAQPVQIKLPDEADKKFIEAAISANIDVLITGNKKHFPDTKISEVKVLSPSEFISLTMRSEKG